MRRTRPAVALAAMALLVPASASAAPGDWELRYDWSASDVGFGGWSDELFDPAPGASDPPAQPPYYVTFRDTEGDGYRLRPSVAADGTADRVYPNYRPGEQSGGPEVRARLRAPGTTTIAGATVGDVDFRNQDEGQIFRVAIVNASDAFDAGSVQSFQRATGFLPGVPYLGVGPFTVGAPAPAGVGVMLSLRTICNQGDVDGACPTVRFDASGRPTSTARVGSLVLRMRDPDAPTATLGGPLAAPSSWTRSRSPQQLTVQGDDPGSGVRSIQVTASSGGRTRTALNRTSPCDDRHRADGPAGRKAQTCPAQDTGTATDAPRQGVTTYTATVRDLSDRVTTARTTIRVDTTPPTALRARLLPASLQRPWINRRDVLPLRASAQDALSGVKRLVVSRSGDAEVGTTELPCAEQCPKRAENGVGLDLGARRADGSFVVPEGRLRLRARADDLAGNRSANRAVGELWLDRTPPTAPTPRLRLVADGTGRATWSRGTDGSVGSGITGYRFRFRFGTGGFGPWTDFTRARARRTRAVARGQRVEVQLQARDRAGNLSRVTSASASRATKATPLNRPPIVPEGPWDACRATGSRELSQGADDVRLFGEANLVDALAGDDRVRGGAGEDCVFGGTGADRLSGGAGDDFLSGGAGDDQLVGGPGVNRLDGGRGNDRLITEAGQDQVRGGDGDDSISTVNGSRDRVNCGLGRDTAQVDRIDEITGCEVVRRGGSSPTDGGDR